MSNEALDKRIACEFMGWKSDAMGYYQVNGNNVGYWRYRFEAHHVDDQKIFSPTTDMRASYVVLEKIASKLYFNIHSRPTRHDPFEKLIHISTFNVLFDAQEIIVNETNLALAISKLAESIMNSPEHAKLFKE